MSLKVIIKRKIVRGMIYNKCHKIYPTSPFGFSVLRHPNHLVPAGANNRNVIITYRFLAAPIQANGDFFWHILTVYFNCNYFPQYTRELLEYLLGISPSGRNPRGRNNLTLHSNFKISRRFTLSCMPNVYNFFARCSRTLVISTKTIDVAIKKNKFVKYFSYLNKRPHLQR